MGPTWWDPSVQHRTVPEQHCSRTVQPQHVIGIEGTVHVRLPSRTLNWVPRGGGGAAQELFSKSESVFSYTCYTGVSYAETRHQCFLDIPHPPRARISAGCFRCFPQRAWHVHCTVPPFVPPFALWRKCAQNDVMTDQAVTPYTP